MKVQQFQRGYILLPVVVTITLLAAIAFLVQRESGMEVNLVAGELEAVRAQYVAEAGLRHASWVAQNSACTAYTLPSTGFGEHSYSAAFEPTGGSPVTITATGTLASGATRSLTRDAVTVYEAPTTVTVQLDNTNGGDVALDSFFNDRNHGANYSYVSTNINQVGHQLIHFDLSDIPPNVSVLSAKLEVYQYSASNVSADATIAVHRATQDWVEGTKQGGGTPDGATWDTYDGVNPWATPGGDIDPQVIASAPVIDVNDVWIAWPVEKLVQGWLSGTYPNQGLLLKGSGSLWVNLAPDEENLADIHPRLTITYACVCGGGGGSTVVLQPGNGLDTYLADGTPATNLGNATEMRLSNKTNNQDRGLLQFSLFSIPADAQVNSAVLELNLEGIGSGGIASVDVHRVTSPWKELQATWNQASAGVSWSTLGGDYDPVAVASAGIDAALPGPSQWDITSLVSAWVDGTLPNHGLTLIGSPDVNHADFSTSDHTDPGLHPKLTVNYTCPCGGCDAIVPVYRDEFNSFICDTAIDYSGSDGSLDWSPWQWSDIGESNDSCGQGVRLESDLGDNRLRIAAPDKGIMRQVDLTPFSVASLRFDYRRFGWSASTDALTVEASTNGGTDWSPVTKVTGPADDAAYQTTEADISAWIGPDTLIRFMELNTLSGSEIVYLDNIQIDSEPVSGGPAGPEYPVLADATVYEGSAGSNYGSDPELDVGKGNPGGGKHYASALRFDLATLPPTATVTSATLRLYQGSASGSGTIDIGLYKADAAWDEGTVTWNTLSDDTIQHALTSVSLGTTDWFEWTLPPGLVHEWRDIANHGLVLRYEGTQKGKVAHFASKEDGAAALHPQLLLVYTE